MDPTQRQLERSIGNGRLFLARGDLTRFPAEALVNAANSALAGGGGVDGALHRAGGPRIMAECRELIAMIGRLEPGAAVATTAGTLPARYLIHTVGPVYRDGTRGEPAVLASAYRSSLGVAEELGLGSVAFPSISTGVYGYPLEAAAEVALPVLLQYLAENGRSVRRVGLVLFSDDAFDCYERVLRRLEASVEARAGD